MAQFKRQSFLYILGTLLAYNPIFEPISHSFTLPQTQLFASVPNSEN